MKRLVALLALACAPAPVPLDRFGIEAEDALCAWAVRCRHVPDEATCRRLVDPKQYDIRRAQDGVAAGRLEYDGEEAARCVDAASDAACLASPFAAPACTRVFAGQVPEEGACTSTFDCVGGGACQSPVCDAQCCVGTCGPPQPPTTPPVLADEGEACVTHAECVPTAYCELDGRCTALPDEVGERCLAGCATGELFCDVGSATCRAYAALGAPCSPDGTSGDPCDDAYAFCDGVCRPRPGAGEPCDTLRRCIASTTCEGGTCTARGTAGAVCSLDAQCDVGCDEAVGQCVAYLTCTP